MPYEIKFLDIEGGVEVCYSGPVTFDQRNQALSDVVGLLNMGQSAKRILVNRIEMDSRLSAAEDFFFGVKLAKTRELLGVRIAVLKKPEVNEDEFTYKVAKNRGALIREFSDYGEALQWLFVVQSN